MTTHPNAQLIRDAYNAAGQGNLQPLLGMLSEDITWTDSTLGPLAGTYTRDQVAQFFATMMDVYDGTLRVEIAGIMADCDHGVVFTRESGTAHDQAVVWTGVHVWTFGQGRVTRFVAYGSAEYQRFWADRQATASN